MTPECCLPSCVTDFTIKSAAIAGQKASHGNTGVWKAWKAMKAAFHPSHTSWKSLQDSHIPRLQRLG